MLKTNVYNEVGLISLNRTEARNSLTPELMAQLMEATQKFLQDSKVRVLLFSGEGDYFCAGADLHWMQSAQNQSQSKNRQEALLLGQLLEIIYTSSKPTVAFVQGPAFGGGVGLALACDLVIAKPSAFFCLSEVKLGLIPAMISPFVIQAMGEANFKRYALTGDKLSAQRAYEMGFVYEVADSPDRVLKLLRQGGPEAQRMIKKTWHPSISPESQDTLATLINQLRQSQEAQDGIHAFFEKRPPFWVGEEK